MKSLILPEPWMKQQLDFKKLHKKVLESAGIFECPECEGYGRIHGTVTRNYTTRAQYEEDIEYPCMNCEGIGTLPSSHPPPVNQIPKLKVWDDV